MLEQGRVQSGFDVEILLGERQLSYVLLGLVDAGRIPTSLEISGTTLQLLAPAQVDRTYEPNPEPPFRRVSADQPSFEVEILFGHPSGADVRVHPVIGAAGLEIDADLFIALGLEAQRDGEGLLESATLHVEVLDLDSPLLPLIESQFGIDKATILANVKQYVDRDVDLGGIGAFKRLQDLELRKLDADDGHPRAYGLYVNLRLQQDPEPDSLLGPRGDLEEARNFLPEGSDMAMASRAGLFGDMATDAFQRYAEIDDDGNVSYPWHKSINNPNSKVIGKIKGVSVGPAPVANTLRIDIHVEYQVDNFFDPDAHLLINLKPTTNELGVMAWSIDADFNASIVLELIGLLVLASLFTGFGAIIGLGLGAAIAGGVMTGMLVDALGHFVVDELYSGRVEKKVDAALPDVISGRVEVAQRRWDPLYTTRHQVAMRLDGGLVNAAGLALWGRAALDREFEPVAHAVIRDKQAEPGEAPTHLRYRVRDAERFRADFTAVAPASDRRDIEQHDPVGEPTLFQLSIAQIVERMKEQRIMGDLAYIAKRIDLREGQIYSLLTISNREINEQRNALISAFEEATRQTIEAEQGDQIRMDVTAELEEAGVTPTQEEIDARVQEIIDELLAPQTAAYLEGPLGGELEQALLPLLRFDLPPEHLAALQLEKILHLLDVEIIKRRDGLLYYRDHPDFYEPDNLLSQPHYRSTPDGPVLP